MTHIDHCTERDPADHDLCNACEDTFAVSEDSSSCNCEVSYHAGVASCYPDIDHCSDYNTEGDECEDCDTGYHQTSGTCHEDIAHCEDYDETGLTCEDCDTNYDLETEFNDCVFHVEHCEDRNEENR